MLNSGDKFGYVRDEGIHSRSLLSQTPTTHTSSTSASTTRHIFNGAAAPASGVALNLTDVMSGLKTSLSAIKPEPFDVNKKTERPPEGAGAQRNQVKAAESLCMKAHKNFAGALGDACTIADPREGRAIFNSIAPQDPSSQMVGAAASMAFDSSAIGAALTVSSAVNQIYSESNKSRLSAKAASLLDQVYAEAHKGATAHQPASRINQIFNAAGIDIRKIPSADQLGKLLTNDPLNNPAMQAIQRAHIALDLKDANKVLFDSEYTAKPTVEKIEAARNNPGLVDAFTGGDKSKATAIRAGTPVNKIDNPDAVAVTLASAPLVNMALYKKVKYEDREGIEDRAEKLKKLEPNVHESSNHAFAISSMAPKAFKPMLDEDDRPVYKPSSEFLAQFTPAA